MSGLIGHTMYAILGAKAAAQKQLPVAPIIQRHFPSYLCGSYLGCDVQTMPEAICVDTGREVGYGTAPLTKSPLTGGAVKPFKFVFKGAEYTPYQIHEMFYGRAHAAFGWKKTELQFAIPWDHLCDYFTLVVQDTLDLFGPGERQLAYVFGWMVHVVGDSLIKSIRPGVTLNLIDGKYTVKNRPIQDLVTFNDIGIKELRLNWTALLTDMSETPVEPVQRHFMRVGPKRGKLGATFSEGWLEDKEAEELLTAVLAENRRYLKFHMTDVLRDMTLEKTDSGWKCNELLSQVTGGLSYEQMVRAAEKARFRDTLRQMGDIIVDLFGKVVEGVPALRQWPADDHPNWDKLSERWRKSGKTEEKP